MKKQASPPPPRWYFSTDDLPERDRFGLLNELFGDLFICDMRPLDQSRPRPHIEGFGMELPGGVVATVGRSAGMRFERTPRHTGRTDDVVLSIGLAGRSGVSQRGEAFTVHPGEAYVNLGDEPGTVTGFREERHAGLSLVLPRRIFVATGLDPGTTLTRPVPRDNHALRMLIFYVRGLMAGSGRPDPELAVAMSSHICDLAALALGATGDAAERARRGGLREARLRAVKADIAAHIGLQRIRLDDVARRQGISPVYVRKLFAGEGTSFSAYCLARRLERAHRMLRSPRFATMTVSDIAYEAGFNDLSHFNRTFRRCYGTTPSEVRRFPA